MTRQTPNHFALLLVDGDLAGGVDGARKLIGALTAARPELTIALSVLVSTVHGARLLCPGREPVVAGLFGLVHGLAFATLTSNFGLGATTRTTAILGFNFGIEAVQVGVVVLALPLLMALPRWQHRR